MKLTAALFCPKIKELRNSRTPGTPELLFCLSVWQWVAIQTQVPSPGLHLQQAKPNQTNQCIPICPKTMIESIVLSTVLISRQWVVIGVDVETMSWVVSYRGTREELLLGIVWIRADILVGQVLLGSSWVLRLFCKQAVISIVVYLAYRLLIDGGSGTWGGV